MGTNAGEGWGDPRVQVVSVFRSTDSDGSLAYVALFAFWLMVGILEKRLALWCSLLQPLIDREAPVWYKEPGSSVEKSFMALALSIFLSSGVVCALKTSRFEPGLFMVWVWVKKQRSRVEELFNFKTRT